jgi:hypothetical protein
MKSTEYDTPPDQGLFLGTAGHQVFLFFLLIRRGGVPSGAAAIIVT